MTDKRWLISFDDQGRECAMAIPHDAVILTPTEFMRAIATGTPEFDTKTAKSLIWHGVDGKTLHHKCLNLESMLAF